MGRRKTLRIVERALRRAFPDRAGALIEEVTSWKLAADLLGKAEHLDRSGLRLQRVGGGTLDEQPQDVAVAEARARDEAGERETVIAQLARALAEQRESDAADLLAEVSAWKARFEEMERDALRTEAVVKRRMRERGIEDDE